MPMFDYLCLDCGKTTEVLVTGHHTTVECKACGSKALKRLLSAHSSHSGASKNTAPGPGDTSCCGSTPSREGCAGPGSCCGK